MSTAVDEVDTFKFPEDDANPFHKLPTLPTLLIPPEMITDNNAKNPIDESAARKPPKSRKPSLVQQQSMVYIIQHVFLSHPASRRSGSKTNRTPMGPTRMAPSTSLSTQATTNDHPSPFNPDPYMHVLGIALLHYSDPDVLGAAFMQPYSFKAGLKKFREIEKKPPSPNLSNCTATQHITPPMPTPSPPKNVEKHYLP